MPDTYVFKVTFGGVVLFGLTAEAQRCAEGGVRGIPQSMRRIIEEEPAIDAATMNLFDRGARYFEFAFTSWVRCADPIAAAEEVMTQVVRADTTGIAAVSILIGSTTFIYSKGAVESISGDNEGNDAVVTYKLKLSGSVGTT